MKRKDREVSRLQSDLENARDEVDRLQEKLLAFTPEVKAKLESEVQTLRKKNQQLEEKIEEAESSASTKGASDAELTSAKRKITSLEERIEDLEADLETAKKEAKAAAAAPAAGDGDAGLKKQVAALEDKVDSLSLDLRKAKAEVEKWKIEADRASKAPPVAAKAEGFDKDGALDALDAIMDLYRSWMSNLGVLKTYGEDIEKGKTNAKALQDAIDGIGQTLTSIEGDADDMRKELKALRNAVEKG
jgi:predicted  nucleic acid-binding Zn-ribbon protein